MAEHIRHLYAITNHRNYNETMYITVARTVSQGNQDYKFQRPKNQKTNHTSDMVHLAITNEMSLHLCKNKTRQNKGKRLYTR